MTAEDAINVFKEQFCGLDAYCEIHRDGLCLTDGCEVWWAIKALEQYKADAVEIIRCKDCKHWIPYDWMFSEVWKSQNIDDYAESEIGCTYCDMSMGAMDYCSRGERKNG